MSFSTQRWGRQGDKRREREIGGREREGGSERKEMKIGQHERELAAAKKWMGGSHRRKKKHDSKDEKDMKRYKASHT